ncbi:Hydroxymethylglutaryl-CoA lyase [Phytophthora nicotianae]|uniref:Hydroxymethylglutaryl-CoA lyase n=1 Tax=Phytophthora nicotianae TaxID=4792 RepID=A0A0W8DD56_PHYNI|nr:Hydroxymethylglutaryl-CoA lyase [Phytophthora nicotianae]
MNKTAFSTFEEFEEAFKAYCQDSHQCYKTRSQDGSTYCQYVVTQQTTIHTHPVNEAIWRAYAENRRVNDPNVVGMVRILVKTKSPFKQIHQYVAESSGRLQLSLLHYFAQVYFYTGKDVLPQDVRNMISKIKGEVKQEPVEIRVDTLLNDFVGNNQGNVANLFKNEADIATCITFQTAGMRKFFHLFPEVLLVDTTHKTNDLKYKLFGFMVHDSFGGGQFVQHALIDAETKENMSTAVATFKTNNPNWTRVEVIMVG